MLTHVGSLSFIGISLCREIHDKRGFSRAFRIPKRGYMPCTTDVYRRNVIVSLLKPALTKCLTKRKAKRLPDHLVIYATHDAQTNEGSYVQTSQGVISRFSRLRTSLPTVSF